MSLRSLRNSAVFWSLFAGSGYGLRYPLEQGWLVTLPVAFVAALVGVVLIAVLTDPFLD